MKLWDLAGKVYIEAIFRGQVLAAGSNVHRLTQSMKSDSGYATRQGRIVQFLGSFYLLMVAFLSVTAFLQLRAGGAVEWNLLVASGSVALQFLIQAGYLVMLTILATAEILEPELYSWLESPAGWSVVAGAVGLIVGLEHAAVVLGVAVLASWRLRKILRSSEGDDRRSKWLRIFTMLAYGLGTILVVFVMQLGSNALSALFDNPSLSPESTLLYGAAGVLILRRARAIVRRPTAAPSAGRSANR
ncbi:MAG: hypothetical protein ACOC2Y_05980 [Spirochaetota bacterium]